MFDYSSKKDTVITVKKVRVNSFKWFERKARISYWIFWVCIVNAIASGVTAITERSLFSLSLALFMVYLSLDMYKFNQEDVAKAKKILKREGNP